MIEQLEKSLKGHNVRKQIDQRISIWIRIVIVGVISLNCLTQAADVIHSKEMQQCNLWTQKYLLDTQAKMPFSFIYDGQKSDQLLSDWPKKIIPAVKLDAVRSQHTMIWTDLKTGLEIRCVAVAYSDYPVVEWTAYFKNTGDKNTPIIENIQGLDIQLNRSDEGAFVLHGIKGDSCTADSFEPYHLTLVPDTMKKFSPPSSGKSSDGPDGWPYYNLQMPDGGVILAIGWPGQWASSFTCDTANGLQIKAGQELTHLFFKPGEEVRTPLIALLFWEGKDVVAAQNIWRRWYMEYVIPHFAGQPQPPLAQIQVGGSDTSYVKNFLDAGIKVDICWRDAAWYINSGSPYKDEVAWLNTGTWEIDPTKYPNGFKPFSDWVHDHGMKFLLWFEPERVGDPNSWLAQKHPEWLLQPGSVGLILNEGNPEALNWLINHTDGMIKSQGIDWYREDMNGGGPCSSWRANDAEDRQGITENLYVQGHLALWDELKRRNPNLHIDSCASGGRRNDLETMRRAVPLLRSDFQWPSMGSVPEGNQGQTYGLSFWLPFQGTGTYYYDSYSFRSFYMASFGMGGLNPENTAAQKQAYAECRRIAPCTLGDYYPLTEYNRQLDQWIAWQFNRPAEGDGAVQAFRRENCATTTKIFFLNGLDPAAQYEITNFDIAGSMKASGKELMQDGLVIEIKDKPGSAVIVYKRLD